MNDTTEKLLAAIHRYRVMVQDVVRNKQWNNMWWMHRLDRAYTQVAEMGVTWDRERGIQPDSVEADRPQVVTHKCVTCPQK